MNCSSKQELGELRLSKQLGKAHSCPYFQSSKYLQCLERIRSCKFVEDNPEGHTAHPYYVRDKIVEPERSAYKESWYSYSFRPKPLCNFAMKNKPLVRYDPSHSRSRMVYTSSVQTINARADTLQLGNPMSPRDIKQQYKSTYNEFFKLPRNRRIKNCSKFAKGNAYCSLAEK